MPENTCVHFEFDLNEFKFFPLVWKKKRLLLLICFFFLDQLFAVSYQNFSNLIFGRFLIKYFLLNLV